MKKKILILLCIIAPLVASCNGEKKEGNVNEQTEVVTVPETETEKEIEPEKSDEEKRQGEAMDLVLKVPEVQKLADYLYEVTNGKHGAAAVIFGTNDEEDSYQVNVGLNGEDRFETHHLFYVHKQTKAISVLHTASARVYPLAEWQERYQKYQAGDEKAFPNDEEEEEQIKD